MLAHCDTAQNGVADVQEMGYNELITHKVWMNWSMLVILSATPSQMTIPNGWKRLEFHFTLEIQRLVAFDLFDR